MVTPQTRRLPRRQGLDWTPDSTWPSAQGVASNLPRSRRLFRWPVADGPDLSSTSSLAVLNCALFTRSCAEPINEEIRQFKASGGSQRVIPVIVGEWFEGPVSTCFPPALGLNVAQNGPFTDEWQEPIAADARVGGDGKRLAEQKVIAALLGLPLDEVIRRAERARKKLSLIRNSIIAALLLLTLASVGGFT